MHYRADMKIHASIKAGLAAVALAGAATPVAAQEQAAQETAEAQQTERPQAINRFEDATIRLLLQDLGARVEVVPVEEGNPRYRASTEGGVNFTAIPAACSAEAGCVGLIVVAILSGFEVPENVDLSEYVHRYNDANPTAKMFLSRAGQVVLQDYINAANVTTYRNAQSQLIVFGNDVVRASRALMQLQGDQ